MNDKWLEELREGLSDFEMDAPEGLWESLGVEKTVPKISWRRRWIAAAAVVLILVIGSGIILWFSDNETLGINGIKYAKTNGSGHTGKSQNNPAGTEKTAPSSIESILLIKSQKINSIKNYSAEIKESNGSYVSNEESSSYLPDTINPENIKPDDQTVLSAEETKQEKEQDSERQRSFFEDFSIKDRMRYSNDYDRFAINLSASGIGSSSAGSNFRMPGMPGDDLFLGSSNTTTKIRHHMPFRIGLTLQYNVTRKIAFESGLIYSAIGSDISLSLNTSTASGSRRLQYVGIPLNMKFSVRSWRFIDLYLSAGVTGEKCISNRFETKHTAEGLSLEAFSSQREKPFQWSVNAGAGIQLRPLPNMGIFVEPGVSYYFNDGTDLSTIYKDHPCNFNLNVGLRFILNP